MRQVSVRADQLFAAGPQSIRNRHRSMLTSRELATLRAALRYWQEEICPHGPAAARLYLESPAGVPLTSAEVRRLRDRFLPDRVRYARCRRSRSYVLQGPLLRSVHAVRPGAAVATVLLPAATRPRRRG